MLSYLNENPILVFIVGVVIVFVLMFVFVKPAKKKTSKNKSADKKSEDKKEDKPKEEPEQVVNTEEVSGDGETVLKKTTKVKKSSQKPEITQVYKRTTSTAGSTERYVSEAEKKEKERLDDLEGRAQFVKSSGKVSKFVGWSDVVAKDELAQMAALEEVQEIVEENEPCEVCYDTTRNHFDHSRRLSQMIQNDNFDDLLQQHISEKYLNFDADRHLKMGSNFEEKLFDRALKTLTNSDVKVLVDDEKHEMPVEQLRNDKSFMREWLNQRKMDEMSKIMCSGDEVYHDELNDEFVEHVSEDVDLSPKNIMVVDAVLKRKGVGKK